MKEHIKRVNSSFGKRMKYLRQSTVEPVFGSLINYYAMRKVNTRGIDLCAQINAHGGNCIQSQKIYEILSPNNQSDGRKLLQFQLKSYIIFFDFCFLIKFFNSVILYNQNFTF